MRKELRHGVEFALYQRLADKYTTRLFHIHRPVMYAFLRIDQQAKQGAALEGCHLSRFFLPVRIVIVALDQMRANLLQPGRFDARHTACIELGGFHNLGSDYPLCAFFCQYRIGCNEEFYLARAEVIRFTLYSLVADIA